MTALLEKSECNSWRILRGIYYKIECIVCWTFRNIVWEIFEIFYEGIFAINFSNNSIQLGLVLLNLRFIEYLHEISLKKSQMEFRDIGRRRFLEIFYRNTSNNCFRSACRNSGVTCGRNVGAIYFRNPWRHCISM